MVDEIKAPELQVENPEFGAGDKEWSAMWDKIAEGQSVQEAVAPVAPVIPQPAVPFVAPQTEIQPAPEIQSGITGPTVDELLGRIPDKFLGKDKDVTKALERMVKSYREVESDSTRKSQELSAALDMLRVYHENSRGQTPLGNPQTEQSSQGKTIESEELQKILSGIEDIPAEKYYENPGQVTKEIALKVANAVAAQERKAFDMGNLVGKVSQAVGSQMALLKIKEDNPDKWDTVSPELAVVLREKPWLGTVVGISAAWEEAKSRADKKLASFKEQVGIMDESRLEQFFETKINQILSRTNQAAELRQNAAALPMSSPGGGGDAVQKVVQPEQKTPEQLVIEGMLGSGDQDPLFGTYFVEPKK